MDTTIWLFAGVAALLLLLVTLQRRGKDAREKSDLRQISGARGMATAPAPAPRQAPGQGYVDKFRGGMVFPQPDACEAACALRGKTFPEGRVPRIPVPGCDREKCGCQVHTVVGRRRGPRRVQGDRRDDIRLDEDRRTGKDRRDG